ncbi:leishmanolysin-like peptidase 2 [Gigantopelta aegis]|uniref:leishmanolysin-like peptidase 2 n=1 Tax=Gigantopelta aegis TaxID=1735272 RepID=UPI001B88A518|nr:leishmanolysin-like peptidase 2 [Gigantopelta aegis]
MGKVDVINNKWFIKMIIIVLICSKSSQFSHNCLFDEVQPDTVPHTNVKYDKSWTDRERRNANATVERSYQAIRISPQFYFGEELVQSEKENLKKVIARAIKKINKLFSVIPVQGPLILQRSACHSVWSSGINKGKCSRIKKGYRGEFCLDRFKLPNDHLEGEVLYDRHHRDPVKYAIKEGSGVNNTDFILYVTSQTTHNCLDGKTSVIAYAAYCQLDQRDRPIAGQVNFCPLLLKPQYFNKDKSYIAALHEMFHALGFSKRLFSKFKACTDSGTKCTRHPQTVREVDEVWRLTTPAVVEKTQDHFGCLSEDDYGGPIDTSDAPLSSHWDSKFMQGSLMTAKNDLPHLTFIDPITLAVFEDTGWYKVNYSQADNYLWGKDSGCLFGSTEFCMIQTNYFCSGSSSGCHYLHLDRGVCSTDTNLSPCRVVMASDGDACFTSGKVLPGNTSSEIISPTGRCFMSNITSQSAGEMAVKGRCYEHKCLGASQLQVQIHNLSWLDCPAGSYLQFPSHRGGIFCPENPEILCPKIYNITSNENTEPVSEENATEVTNTVFTSTTQFKYDNSDVTIEMMFKSTDDELSWNEHVKSEFEKSVVDFVVRLGRVSAARIQNIDSYFTGGEATVIFILVGAGDIKNEPVAEMATHKLEEALISREQSIEVAVSGEYKTLRLQGVSRKYPTWFSDSMKKQSKALPELKPEVIVGILLAIVAIIVLLTVITMIVRRKKSFTAPSGRGTRGSEQPLVGSSLGTHAEPSGSGQSGRLAQIAEHNTVLAEESRTDEVQESTSAV